MNQIEVIVPGTTANLGAGFDCIGAALTIYNEFKFSLIEGTDSSCVIQIKGAEAEKVGTDKTNLVYQSFVKLYQHIGQPVPSVVIEIQPGVPLARGLGSSATAIVGGLVGANELASNPLSPQEIVELAIALEGHPDNVVPALLGNCQLSVGEMGNWQIAEIPWHQDIIPVVAIPNFELSTSEARAVLPPLIPHQDAIFNISRLGLLIRALAENNSKWLTTALQDRLHQPYRQKLITGYELVQSAALAAGAYGMVISGAGPTLLALTAPRQVEQVVKAMKQAWTKIEVAAEVIALNLDKQGARLR